LNTGHYDGGDDEEEEEEEAMPVSLEPSLSFSNASYRVTLRRSSACAQRYASIHRLVSSIAS
jgi:hypothetical protein